MDPGSTANRSRVFYMKKLKVRKKMFTKAECQKLLDMLEKSEREYEQRQRDEARDLWKLMLEPITI